MNEPFGIFLSKKSRVFCHDRKFFSVERRRINEIVFDIICLPLIYLNNIETQQMTLDYFVFRNKKKRRVVFISSANMIWKYGYFNCKLNVRFKPVLQHTVTFEQSHLRKVEKHF